MLKKLRWKFVGITMAVVTVMLCVILGLVLLFTHRSLEQEGYQRLGKALAAQLSPGRPGEGRGDGDVLTLILTTRGDLIVSGGQAYDLSDQDYLLDLARDALEAGEEKGQLKAYGLRFCREDSPGGVKLCFADTSGERQVMTSLALSCAGIGVVSLVGFFLLSLLLARWAVRPVEKAWQQQKQFVADASHELKTPLAVITTNAELLQQPERTEEEKTQFSENILTMSRQMRSLVEGLLELARGDNEALGLHFARVDLSELARDTGLLFEPVAYERGLSLEMAITDQTWVMGSESHLRQVMEILLDNGVKYSQGSGCIRLWLTQNDRACVLAVDNPGPEIPKEEQEKIFDRFYRADKARTGGSFGLGLAIARSLVEAHGGRIWVESGGGINRFGVQLPKA